MTPDDKKYWLQEHGSFCFEPIETSISGDQCSNSIFETEWVTHDDFFFKACGSCEIDAIEVLFNNVKDDLLSRIEDIEYFRLTIY